MSKSGNGAMGMSIVQTGAMRKRVVEVCYELVLLIIFRSFSLSKISGVNLRKASTTMADSINSHKDFDGSLLPE